jgi:hypothetical protein
VKFLIRDDDPCAMTSPEELESCWAGIWDRIPIGFSVTPFRVPGNSETVPEEFRGDEEALPLEENREMVAYLRDLIRAGRAYIAMHGYNHTNPDGKPEYVAANDLGKKTLHGRRYLETLLGCEVRTFVPPNNAMGLEGFAAVAGAGMNIVNNQPYARMLGFPTSPTAAADVFLGARNALRRRLGRLSLYSVQSYSRFKQAPYQTIGPSTDLQALEEAFDACRQQDGIFILATHYHAFGRLLPGGERVGDTVVRFVDEALSLEGVEFATYDGVWNSAHSR